MEKVEVRKWVRETLEDILKDEIDESTNGNVKICIHKYFDSIVASEIHIEVQSVTKEGINWEDRCYLDFCDYFSNYYEMITKPWFSDMVTDLTDSIIEQKGIYLYNQKSE